MSWDQISEGIDLPFDPALTIPDLYEFQLSAPATTSIGDAESVAFETAYSAFKYAVTPGMTIAVGAGSRGLTGRVELLKGTLRALRDLGGEPFVVPAMGSHGGATAHGQVAMLASLGITEQSLDAEIRSTMDTVIVATTKSGTAVHLDANAASADRFLPVNRIKPHTCFKGPIESGCTKMAAVGFGKVPGAALVHSCGPVEMRDRLLDAVDALRSTGRLLGGIGSIESAAGDIVRIEGLSADDVGGKREHELTEFARTMVPVLPFDQIDVLIVELGGKDISGTTIDPNVTGRFWVPGLDDLDKPSISAIVLLDLTDVSGGNALGIGFADFIPVSLANKLDWRKTYINCFTAGSAGMRRSRMPMVLADEEACIKAALSMCGRGVDEPKRVVRIKSTMHLQTCQVSALLLP